MEELFKNIGGEFITPFLRIAEKQKNIRAFIFDWDGVFNSGIIGEGYNSIYNEADEMGLNLLRFSYWLKHRDIPITTIICGENNTTAFNFAKNEHLQSVYFSIQDKINALEHLYKTYGISHEQTAYIFDDVLDLPIAQQCGLKFLIRRNASPVFTDYVKNKKLCDYVSGNTGGEFAVREICELLLYSTGEYNNTIEERIASSYNYKDYLAKRDEVKTNFFTLESGIVVKKEIK